MCHVSIKHCRSTTLGISVVTPNPRLHDTRSQNTGVEKRALPVSRNGSVFQAGVDNDSDRIISYFIISHQEKLCRFKTMRIWLLLQKQCIILLQALFPRLQHVFRSMCPGFPMEAAQSCRFSCNTLVNSPTCQVIADKAPASSYHQLWFIFFYFCWWLCCSLLLWMTPLPENTHTQNVNVCFSMSFKNQVPIHCLIISSCLPQNKKVSVFHICQSKVVFMICL